MFEAAVANHPTDTLAHSKALLRQNYLADNRPWVVAYSGGKDSTLTLQLVVDLLSDLGNAACKPVYVVSSDTLVEAPNVAAYVEESLDRIETFASSGHLPLYTRLVRPDVEERFWFNVIGKGYPTPTRTFRWCTTKMKIKPTRRIIEEIVRDHGSVLLLLGSRSAESSRRSQSMDSREISSRGLNPHHEIPNALVLAPIADWTTDDVWEYLFTHNPPPWGGSHDFMLELYRQATGGECPVVLDLNTPSCGGSRFGCWTCTVVKQDKSIEGFIQSGEERLRPLQKLRNHLKIWREDMTLRMPRRRDNSPGPGPFTLEGRKRILEALLETERVIGNKLISDEELIAIQAKWESDKLDGARTALAMAARHGREITYMGHTSQHEKSDDLLIELASEYDIQESWATDLVRIARDYYPRLVEHGTRTDFLRDVKRIVEQADEQVKNTDATE